MVRQRDFDHLRAYQRGYQRRKNLVTIGWLLLFIGCLVALGVTLAGV